MSAPSSGNAWRERVGVAFGLVAVALVVELLGPKTPDALSIALRLSWATFAGVLALLSLVGRLTPRVLSRSLAIASVTLYPALILTTGGANSDLYVGLDILPLLLAIFASNNFRAVLFGTVASLGWTVVVSHLSGDSWRATAFDALIVALAGGAGLYGVRRLIAERVKLLSEKIGALERAALLELRERESARVATVEREAQNERRERLSQRLVALGQIAATVAHEINNPLSYVLANLKFVEEELGEVTAAAPLAPRSVDELRQVVAESRAGLARISEIVRDTKGASRDDGRKASVDLKGLLESTARMVAPVVRQKAGFSVDVFEAPALAGRAGELGQVFMNLLVNAAQAISAGSVATNTVRLIARAVGGNAVVEISDTGAGMSDAIRARLFEPFFTTKAEEGTGLGLALCQRIVAEHGGAISVDTEPGKGSTFRVVLPSGCLQQTG